MWVQPSLALRSLRLWLAPGGGLRHITSAPRLLPALPPLLGIIAAGKSAVTMQNERPAHAGLFVEIRPRPAAPAR